MSKLEKMLLKATKISECGSGEKRQKFLVRAMLGVQKLPDDDWENLDQGLQDWYNAATEADNEKKPIPDFPDVKEEDLDGASEEEDDVEEEDDAVAAEAEEDQDEGEEEKEVVKTKSKTPAAKKKASAAPAPAKTPAKKVATGNGASKKPAAAAPVKKTMTMRRTLKMIVVKKPSISTEALIEQLEKKGFKSPSKLTVTSIRSDTRDTIRVLNEAGMTRIEL